MALTHEELASNDIDWPKLVDDVTARIHALRLVSRAMRDMNEEQAQMFRRDLLLPSLELLAQFVACVEIGTETIGKEERLQ